MGKEEESKTIRSRGRGRIKTRRKRRGRLVLRCVEMNSGRRSKNQRTYVRVPVYGEQ